MRRRIPPTPDHATDDRWRDERRARDRAGRRAEWIAALALRLRGYRILGRREKTPLGEIDLIAVRGRRVAFVEVKRRASEEAAEAAITDAQRARIRRAAQLWLARNARYQTHEQGFDVIFLIGRRWPRHVENGL
ncbi:YraN family protein [Hyphomicrobium sp.]|uniref:YraN family protein n=1 Tax=Hyphomicrobium sp. TaxID=82 RepID=UPI0025C614BF|nr:YraN family protein [Hyphomicrobium sp.]MCC7250424.1 YraN family protein [Hyphomicrobium sp.]